MENYKPGGGNKPQLYDPNNGQYTSEEKDLLFDLELKNIKEFIDAKVDTFEPRFPIFGFHNDEYCKLYSENIFKTKAFNVEFSKIKDYLLVYKKEGDKSNFLLMYLVMIKKIGKIYLKKYVVVVILII